MDEFLERLSARVRIGDQSHRVRDLIKPFKPARSFFRAFVPQHALQMGYYSQRVVDLEDALLYVSGCQRRQCPAEVAQDGVV